MKKNKLMRLASALLVLTLLSTCAISGTFAKYTSSATGSDIATVAKWSFKVNGTEIAVSPAAEISFGLFDTIKDTAGAEESDVKTNLIAPGTSGSFELKVENTSEVTAKYTIALAETNDSGIPLQYSVDGNNWVDSVAELSMTGLTEKQLDKETGTATHTVYWRWVFEGTTDGAHANQTDATDTTLGIAAQTTAPTVTITATVTATQVD